MTRDGTMIGKFPGVLLLLTALSLAGTLPAMADANWKTSSSVWRAMDNCNKAARKAFPDYTRESNAKREAARQNCLRAGNLPGEGSAPPPVPQASEATPPQ
ncbi:MAG: hypothetical protein ACLQJR_21190 [Stellaceae bacterium]